jgi:hypothetical protein
MEKLIEALQIFLKYRNLTYPIHSIQDELLVVVITREEVSQEDVDKLNELGFRWSYENDCWSSFTHRYSLI